MGQDNNLSLREKAMNWWNNYKKERPLQLQILTNTYFKYRNWDSLTGSEIETIYKKGHPVLVGNKILSYQHETETNLIENKNIEDAAIKYANPNFENEDNVDIYAAGHFVAGATWQKEKDKELILELLDALQMANATLGSCMLMKKEIEPYLNIVNISKERVKIIDTIIKTDEYLKNQ